MFNPLPDDGADVGYVYVKKRNKEIHPLDCSWRLYVMPDDAAVGGWGRVQRQT